MKKSGAPFSPILTEPGSGNYIVVADGGRTSGLLWVNVGKSSGWFIGNYEKKETRKAGGASAAPKGDSGESRSSGASPHRTQRERSIGKVDVPALPPRSIEPRT